MNRRFDIIKPLNPRNPITWFTALFLAAVIGLIVSKGIVAAAGLIILPFSIYFIIKVFENQQVGLISMLILSFIAIGLSRYIKGVPFGLTIDGVLILTYLALYAKNFHQRIDWSPAKNSLTVVAAIWFAYSLAELVNPEAVSKVAWFYAMRGVSFYFILTVPLCFILFNQRKDLRFFLRLWSVFAILATLKGMQQIYIKPDPFEQAWLNGGGYVTHILFGKLRAFSFFSDAGQFGAAQAHAGVVLGIVGWHCKDKRDRILYFIASLAGFYGMFISGTRGAIAVPFGGFLVYFLLRKNIRILLLGAFLGIAAFGFFKYTNIGNDNQHIRRMRTAFDPQDRSLQVRLENQRKLKVYMASRPFGGGIGSAGNWGLRFSPNSYLAQTPTDSWYVKIWAEMGIVGLVLHLSVLFYIIGRGAYIIGHKVKDPEIKYILIALEGGILGIMIASYGNGVLGQIPTGQLLYFSMAFIFMGERLSNETQPHELPSNQ